MAGQGAVRRFNWAVLQAGQLPLRPDGQVMTAVEHRCTSVLVWPEGERPSADRTVLVDPCFTEAGYAEATRQLAALGACWEDVSRVFITHPHGDHLPTLPRGAPPLLFRRFRPAWDTALAGLATAYCPGHDPFLRALIFTAPDGRAVWAVGDAVLDEEWLRAWGYYWPNGYTAAEVAETWRSAALIVAGADIILPGHGGPIAVTIPLVTGLLETFPRATAADECPDVAASLRARLAALAGRA